MLDFQSDSGEAVQNKPRVCTSQCTLSTDPKPSKLGRVGSGRTSLNQINVAQLVCCGNPEWDINSANISYLYL